MAAPGTAAARRERVPDRTASGEGPFGRLGTRAAPTARCRRLPAAPRTADTLERVVVFGPLAFDRDLRGVDVVPEEMPGFHDYGVFFAGASVVTGDGSREPGGPVNSSFVPSS